MPHCAIRFYILYIVMAILSINKARWEELKLGRCELSFMKQLKTKISFNISWERAVKWILFGVTAVELSMVTQRETDNTDANWDTQFDNSYKC